MIFYYGSETLFEKPIYGYGNTTNDYGVGFYMTSSSDSAKLWASKFEKGGYILKFEVPVEKLNVLQLNSNTEEDVLKWITILVKHRFGFVDRETYKDIIGWLLRHFDIDLSGVDMVVGYRADDAYFRYALDFVAGNLSIEKLLEAMKIGSLGLQYVLISRKAYSSAKFLGSKRVEPSNQYSDFREATLKEYKRIKEDDNRFTNTFIGELMKKYGE